MSSEFTSSYSRPTLEDYSSNSASSSSATTSTNSSIIPISPATMNLHLDDHSHTSGSVSASGTDQNNTAGNHTSSWRTNHNGYAFHLDPHVYMHDYPIPYTHPHQHSSHLSSPSYCQPQPQPPPQSQYDLWSMMANTSPITPTQQTLSPFERPPSAQQVQSQRHYTGGGNANDLGLVFSDGSHGNNHVLHNGISPSRSRHEAQRNDGHGQARGIDPHLAFPYQSHQSGFHPSANTRSLTQYQYRTPSATPNPNQAAGPSKRSTHLTLPPSSQTSRTNSPASTTTIIPVPPSPSTTPEAIRLSEEAAYLARQDTKERPPPHLIERERAAVDWQALRFTGNASEVIAELMRMTTKSLKNPGDIPKRPMNGFMIFTSIRRPQIAKSHPKNGNGENSKILAREWTWYMPDYEKQYWQDLADDYRDEFKRRFPQFQYRRLPPSAPLPHTAAHLDRSTAAGAGSRKKRRYSEPSDEELIRSVRPSNPRANSAITYGEIRSVTDLDMVRQHGYGVGVGYGHEALGGPSVLTMPRSNSGENSGGGVPVGGEVWRYSGVGDGRTMRPQDGHYVIQR